MYVRCSFLLITTMLVSYARFYFIAALFLPFLLKGGLAWHGRERDQKRLMKLCETVINDLARKGQAVWHYRKVYQQYVSYAIGERVYVIRARFAEMLRSYLRNQFKQKRLTVNDLVRNALLLQKKTQTMYEFKDELIEFDIEISNSANYLNKSRFGDNNCQIAGPPCDIRPRDREEYRRSMSSKNFGSMDKTLQLMDARRAYIKNKYKEDKFPRPIDIDAELNRSLNIKHTTISGSKRQNTNTGLIDLLPDFIY